MVIAKAYSMLGFLKTICKDFKSVEALKSVFFAHVRSRLEYASNVWSPYYQKDSDAIESIQKKCLIYALRRSVRRDENYRLSSYSSRCRSVGIESISRRRINLSVMFAFDVLSSRIDSPDVISKFVVNAVDRPLRNVRYFTLDAHRSNYGIFEPVNYESRAFIVFAHLYDGAVSRYSFRASVRSAELTGSMLKSHGFLISLH